MARSSTRNQVFFFTSGSFVISWIKIDNWKTPSKQLKIYKETLYMDNPQILIIPSGFASGFKALEIDSTIMIFSDLPLEESNNDIIRYDVNYWKFDG